MDLDPEPGAPIALTEARELDPPVSVELEAPADQCEPCGPDPEYEDTFDPIWHDGGNAIDLGIEQLRNGAEYNQTKWSFNSCRIACEA